MTRTFLLVSAALVCALGAHAWAAEELRLGCEVEYQAGEGSVPELTTKIRILPSLPAQLPDGNRSEVSSEHGTSRLTIYRSNTMRPGPWTTIIEFSPGHGRKSVLKFDEETGVEARWLNEKMVFVRVWWGRIVSSDLVFDTEEAAFAYRELAHYGSIVDAECP